jgi:hypothetical protein
MLRAPNRRMPALRLQAARLSAPRAGPFFLIPGNVSDIFLSRQVSCVLRIFCRARTPRRSAHSSSRATDRPVRLRGRGGQAKAAHASFESSQILNILSRVGSTIFSRRVREAHAGLYSVSWSFQGRLGWFHALGKQFKFAALFRMKSGC